MELTIDTFLHLVDELPKNKEFDYVKPGSNKIKLDSVDFNSNTINATKIDAKKKTSKSANISFDNIKLFTSRIVENRPIHIESIWNGSGSSRSAWEGLFAHTKDFYVFIEDRKKYLVWVPSHPHIVGEIVVLPDDIKDEISFDATYIIENHDVEVVTTVKVDDMKRSFLLYLQKTSKQMQIFDVYVNSICLKIDPLLKNGKYGYDSIYQITSEKIVVSVIQKLVSTNPECDGLLADSWDEASSKNYKDYVSWTTLRKYRDYLILLDASSFIFKVNKTSYNKIISDNVVINSLPHISALRTKPFLLLAGISGTGKSRIVRELAFKSCPEKLRDKDGTTPGNYCMIEVKPNWHDSSELLGYYSNISKKYVYTKFVKFLVKAMRFPNVPFFVCLDEMNLAPVEQYFAEFLSVLETRKMAGDKVVTGPLVDKSFFSEIYETNNNDPTDEDWYNYFFGIKKEVEIPPMTTSEVSPKYGPQSLKEKGLCLPENVFVIGTVNMDDTTHQFSRKVIDRAMTIEMNGGKLEDMFGGSKNLEYLNDSEIFTMDHIGAKYVSADDVLEYCERMNNDEVRKFVTGKDDDGNIITDGETLPKMLYKINDILKNTPFQVSYRVLNELVIYLAVLLDEDKDGKPIEDLAKTALDNIMLMKILPRIEGDSEMFNQSGEDNKLVELQKMFAPESKSHEKLDEMIKRLESTEFTRFWP